MVLLNARFIGLLGDVRSRAVGLAGAVFERVDERKASLDGGKGTARGEGVCGGLLKVEREGFEAVRFGEDEGVGDWLGDLRFHCKMLVRYESFYHEKSILPLMETEIENV